MAYKVLSHFSWDSHKPMMLVGEVGRFPMSFLIWEIHDPLKLHSQPVTEPYILTQVQCPPNSLSKQNWRNSRQKTLVS